MKKKLLYLGAILLGNISFGQLNTGDIMFTGFNADGDDNVSFVNLEDIPANTTIYFSDSEWDGTSFGTDENDFTWNSGTTVINAGTVIKIDDLDATISSSHGTVNGGTGLSKNGDALFAYLGTALRQPTTFLTAIANTTSAFGDLTGTGLIQGLTATCLTDVADIAEYTGTRTGVDKNGFFSLLNDMNNWVIQDTGADDHNDGTAPDLPFSTTNFTFSITDVSAPFVASVNVLTSTSLELIFSEDLDQTTAENLANYLFTPAIAISTVLYDQTNNKVTITHAGLANGISTTITVDNISDLANNSMSAPFTSDDFFLNTSTPNLVFSEIMYNAPTSSSDDLEFIEIYNAEATTVALGGLVVMDEGNFSYVFPEMDLLAGETVLLATNKTFADAFYGTTFLSLSNSPANLLGNGGELLQLKNSLDQLITEVEYDDATPWDPNADGNGYSLEYMSPTLAQNDGTSWIVASNVAGVEQGTNIFASPGSYTEQIINSVFFDEEFYTVVENEGSIDITVSLTTTPTTDVTFDLNLISNLGTTVPNFTNQSITFQANGASTQTVTIDITDDNLENNDGFFALEFSNLNGVQLGSVPNTVIYVIDEDENTPIANGDLDIEHLTSYLVDANGTAEIVAYDENTKRLFVLNASATAVEIIDFNDPHNITTINSVDMTSYGIGATSVAVHNNIVVATVDVANFGNGKVVFMDTDGNLINSVEVGNLPDMICFTPDGNKVLTANEGQPNDDYSIDPEGSISIIDISNGIASLNQSNVNTLTFNAFDSQEALLKASGVRIFGENANVSRDMEPEYITIADNSELAWVSLQENNAYAIIDIVNATITEIIPFGTKDHSLSNNKLDASDKTDSVALINFPVKGMYMPDAIASYSVNGINYIVTANEGDQREFGPIDEDVSIGDASFVLDPTVFPNAELMKKDILLGRLAASPYSGDTDGDGDIDEIHIFGARSFSIWNAETGVLAFDSGDDFERITANDPIYGELFNASNSNNNFKNRSDNKGPEPEGITVQLIGNAYYAFITLERTGGMMVYNITDPNNPEFVKYINNRDLGSNEGGDLGPEGIIYIDKNISPNDTALVIMANEVSSTISVYTVVNKNTAGTDELQNENVLVAYPNPANDKIYFSTPVTGKVVNQMGQVVATLSNKATLSVSNFKSGMYILVLQNGENVKLVIEK